MTHQSMIIKLFHVRITMDRDILPRGNLLRSLRAVASVLGKRGAVVEGTLPPPHFRCRLLDGAGCVPFVSLP